MTEEHPRPQPHAASDAMVAKAQGQPDSQQIKRRVRRIFFGLSLLAVVISLCAYFWPLHWNGPIPVFDTGGKAGLINADGRIIADLKWDLVTLPDSEGVARMRKGDLAGLINTRERLIKPPEWISINKFDASGLAMVENSDKFCGWINRRGEVVIPPLFQAAEANFDERGEASVRKDGKYGLINTGGKFVIKPRWSWLGKFDSKGMAAVFDGPRFGWINRNDEIVIPPKWEADSYPAGWLNMGDHTIYSRRIDATSAPIFDQRDMALVKSGGLYGWINRKGETVIDFKWRFATGFDANDTAPVWENDKIHRLIDRAGNFVTPEEDGGNTSYKLYDLSELEGPPEAERSFTEKSQQLAAVYMNGGWGWVNRDNEFVIEPQWGNTLGFCGGELAAVERDDKWGWIDTSGKVVLPLEWEMVNGFDDQGMAAVRRDGNWGWINREGNLLISNRYASVLDFNEDGLAYVLDSDKIANMSQRLGLSEHGKPVSPDGYWIDRKGNPILQLPDASWEWFAVPTWQSAYKAHPFPITTLDSPTRGLRYMAVTKNLQLSGVSKYLENLWQWLGWDDTDAEKKRLGCIVFDPAGEVIWDNRWIRFESKCIAVLVVSLLAAFLTRPTRSEK